MYIILTIICVHEYEILILIYDIFFTELESVTTTEVVDTISESVYLTSTSVIERVGEETTLLEGLEVTYFPTDYSGSYYNDSFHRIIRQLLFINYCVLHDRRTVRLFALETHTHTHTSTHTPTHIHNHNETYYVILIPLLHCCYCYYIIHTNTRIHTHTYPIFVFVKLHVSLSRLIIVSAGSLLLDLHP